MSRQCFHCNEIVEMLPFNCRHCGQMYCSEHRLPEKHDCFAFEKKIHPKFQTSFTSSEPNLTRPKRGTYSQNFKINYSPTNYSTINHHWLLSIPIIIAFLVIPMMGTFSSGLGLYFEDKFQTREDVLFYINLIQFLTQMLCVILLILISKMIFNQSLRKGYLLDRRSLNVGVQIFLALIFFTGIIIDNLVPTPNISRPLSAGELIFDLCSVLIGAPLMEELLFRKLLIPALKRRGSGDLLAAVFSALTFALAHTPGDIQTHSVEIVLKLIFSRFVAGLFLSFSFIKTQKVATPMLIHFLWNLKVSLNNYAGAYFEISILGIVNILFILTTTILAIIYGIYIFISRISHRDSIWESMIQERASPRVNRSIFFSSIVFIMSLLIFEVLERFLTNLGENWLESNKIGFILNVSVLGILIISGIIINLKTKFKQKQRNI